MAPVGRPFTSGRGLYLKDENVENGKDNEAKSEPPDRSFSKDVLIKIEDDDDNTTVSYVPMNVDEETVIKEEESDESMEEDEKSDVDILDVPNENPVKVCTERVEDIHDISDKSLLCKFCGKQFFRAFYFNLHIKTHKLPTQTSDKPEKPHKCLECGKSFALLQHLTGHSRIHIAGRYYECPVCRRKFTELSNLTMHLLKTHPDEKPYKCTECDKQFTQSSALKKHLRSHSSVTSQNELDRIDMLFFVNDKNERESEEPLKKKIKLEKEEKTSPIKETINVKERLKEGKSPPIKEKSLPSKQKSVQGGDVLLPDLKASKASPTSYKNIKSPLHRGHDIIGKISPAKDKIVRLKQKCPREKKSPSPQEKGAVSKVDPTLSTEFLKVQPKPSKDQFSPVAKKSPGKDMPSKLGSEPNLSDHLYVKDEPSPENFSKVTESVLTVNASPPAKVVLSPSKELPAEEVPIIPTEALLLHIKEECPDDENSLCLEPSSVLNVFSDPTPSLNELSEEFDSIPSTERGVEEESLLSKNETSLETGSSLDNPNDSFLGRNSVAPDLASNNKVHPKSFTKPELEMESQNSKISPMKLISVCNDSLESQDSNEDTENSNQMSTCSDKELRPAFLTVNNSNIGASLSNNKSDKKEPRPCIEKPDGDFDERYKCLRCDVFLDTEELLHEHLMEHTGVKLCECQFCGKDFTSTTSLKRHLYYHAAGSIPQDCTRCGKNFSTFLDLKDHCVKKCDAFSNDFRFKCFRCKKHAPSLERLKFHLLSQCNEDPVKYYLPKKRDSIVSDFEGSRFKSDKSNSRSTMCKYTDEWVNQKFEKHKRFNLDDISELNLGASDMEALQVLNELGPADRGKECWNLQCENCGHKFENAEKAKVHCKLGCKAIAEEKEEFENQGDAGHLKELGQKLVKDAEEENVKIKVVVEEDEDLQCFLNCAVCGKEVAGVEKMLLHIKDHINQRNTLECPVLKCGRFFTDPKDFKSHLKSHTGHKPYKCSECGKRFFLRENYENHAQRHGVLKHWSSLSANEKKGKVSGSARSPITIESSISNLEVSESDCDKKQNKSSNGSSQLSRHRADLQSKENRKQDLPVGQHKKPTSEGQSPKVKKSLPAINKSVPPVNGTVPLVNKPLPLVNRSSPITNRPPILNKSSPTVNKTLPTVNITSPPTNEKPSPPMNKNSPPMNRSVPSVSRQIPTISRPIPIVTRPIPALLSSTAAVIRPASLLQGSPSVISRLSHAPAGSLSVTSQGIFTVGPPRSFSISPPSSSKPTFTMVRTRQELTQKEISQTRAHPASYYRLSDQAKATIQASNAELRKYPRSGRCEICKKTCSRLDKHMMVHLNQKPHLCPVCPQAFRQSEHLRRHIRARHEGNHRQFECPQCHKRLTRKDKLKEHMKNCGIRPYPESYSPTLSDSLFDMIPGPSESHLQGHTTV